MSFESASLDAIRWERNELKKADALYWQGKETGLSDADFDAMSADCGHISQPPRTLKGWASYPDYPLLKPNYGLKKVSYEIAKNAVRYWPKWDGLFLQVFEDENGKHCVTRGDGKIGKDLQPFFQELGIISPENTGEYELIYSRISRDGLCADLSQGYILKECYFIPHNEGGIPCKPPAEIPERFGGFAIDGWVIQLGTSEKFKYKG